MAQFSVNPTRMDPYKQFKFRVRWDGRIIPGIIRVSGLRRVTEVVQMREGNEPSHVRLSPGRTVYQPIVLERGRTHDESFEQWANKVWKVGVSSGNESSLADFRKDVIIELLNEAGQVVMAFLVYRCWPSEYQALGDLEANAEAEVAIETLTLQHEGWERDHDVSEPVEPSFSD